MIFYTVTIAHKEDWSKPETQLFTDKACMQEYLAETIEEYNHEVASPIQLALNNTVTARKQDFKSVGQHSSITIVEVDL